MPHPVIVGFASYVAFLSALFEKQMDQCNAWRAGDAEILASVVARRVARVHTRGLHAIDARTVVGCQFYSERPAVAGPSTLCAGDHSRRISSAYRRLSAQGGARHDPGR